MKLCIECKSRAILGAEPCRTCVKSFPNKPEFILHPELENNEFTVYKTGLYGGLRK